MRGLASETLSDFELRAIGTIIVNFTDLDFAAGHLLMGFIGGDATWTLVAGEDISWKLDKLSVIADEHLTDERARGFLRDWVRASRMLVERRNQLIHAFYMIADGDEATSRWKVSTRGGRWKGHREPVVLDHLTEFADLLAQGWDAAQEVEEQLRACPEWHNISGPVAPASDSPAGSA